MNRTTKTVLRVVGGYLGGCVAGAIACEYLIARDARQRALVGDTATVPTSRLANVAVTAARITDKVRAAGSAYGAGAPSYPDAELQRSALEGRLNVAIGIRDRAEPGSRTHTRWAAVVDELLDRLLEVRGR